MTRDRVMIRVRQGASVLVALGLICGMMISADALAVRKRSEAASAARRSALSGPAWVTAPLPVGWKSLAHGYHHGAVETLGDDVWIAGRRVIIHYDGEATEILASDPMSASIQSIDMTSPGQGWIAGGSGTLYEFDGESWTESMSPVKASGVGLDDLEMDSEDSGVACGTVEGGGGRALHWNSLFWQTRHMPTWSCDDLSVVAPDDVWAVGQEGIIAHFDGTTWSAYTSPTTVDLRAIDMVSPDEGWAAGDRGIILHYLDSEWSVFTPPGPADSHINALEMVSTTLGWAGGSDLFKYTGESWVTETVPVTLGGGHDHSQYITDISMVSDTEGWAVGTMNLILRYTTETGGSLAGIGERARLRDRRYFPHVFSNLVRR